jgi:hypothetical protein
LRTIAARQDKRIRIYYRPEIEKFISLPSIDLEPISNSPNNGNINEIINSVSSGDNQVWQAISELQKQQQLLLNALKNISNKSDQSKT